MADVRYEDLFDAAAVANAEQHLKGRLDSAVDGVQSTADEPKRATGFMGRCANTGYLIFRLAGKTVSVLDLAVVNALAEFAALDVAIPPGQTLSVHELSTTGTGSCSCTVRYEVGA
jgi:hypothetical protein